MGRTWILDTGTKGTGASVVPLDREQKPPRRAEDHGYIPPKQRPRRRPEPAPAAKPKPARRFRIVDLLTRETLADDVDLRTALRVLRDVDAHLDVHVHVHDAGRDAWRLLTMGEQRALWDARHRGGDQA